jgi:hypothetical protein
MSIYLRSFVCGFVGIAFACSVLPAAATPDLSPVPPTASRAAFDKWQESLEAGLRDKPAETIVATPELCKLLMQSEVLRACGADKVWETASRKGGAAFLHAFLADDGWVESFLSAGPADFAQSLENLRLLYRHCQGWDDAVVKRMGTALALQAGALNRYRLVDRLQHLQKARRDGLLHVGFERMTVREMRSAIYMPGTAKDYQFLLDDRQYKTGDYLGACGAINYVDPNVYGFSVQGWGFVEEWCHYFGTGTGNRPLIAQRQVGGVCGTLSCYGASCAQAHGVMSTTVGQPGHCAYVVRIGDRWPIGNDVFGPWTTGYSVYEGTSYMTSDRLYELVEADRLHHERAQRLSWVAHARRNVSGTRSVPPVKVAGTLRVPSASGARGETDTKWQAIYEQALAAQPLCYPIWLEYIKALEAEPSQADEKWLELARRVATTFSEHQEAGWALAMRCYGHVSPNQKPAQRAAFLLACHKTLSQKTAPKMYGYPLLTNFLNAQADLIADPTAALDFYGQLLNLHYSTGPSTNWIFGMVMNWGSERFARNPATAAGYARIMGGFFASQEKTIDKDLKLTTIANGIRKATEVGDANSYRQWNELAKKLLPPTAPADVHLNPQQAAARPKIEPLPGTLLSPSGVLQTSSAAGGCDKPLSYQQVLDGGPLGYFDTNGEANPWAQVQLAGDAELSAIVLIDRYELPAEYPWDVPLKVSVSTDGKAWNEVARFDKPQAVYRVDLQAKKPHARFVRIERIAADPAKPNTARFHFRSFLVYGRKLY